MDLDSDLDFILFEIKYNNEVKWVEKDGIAVGYEDVINLAKNAFNLNDDEDLKLYDTGGAEIPQNVFLKWVLKHKTIGPFEVKKTQKPVETTNQKPPEPKTDETTADDGNKAEDSAVVKIIKEKLSNELKYVKEQYDTDSMLTEDNRKKLVNTITFEMNRFCKEKRNHLLPTNEDRAEWARATVKILPHLRYPGTQEGYELFWDPKTRSGFYANRMKNYYRKNENITGPINRATYNYKKKNAPETSKSNKKIKTSNDLGDNVLDEEKRVQEEVEKLKAIPDIKFMISALPRIHLLQIKEKMFATFEERRKMVTNNSLTKYVFDIFPRFLDVDGLISSDFERLHPRTDFESNWGNVANIIWEIYQKRGPFVDEVIDENLDELSDGGTYKKEIREFFALILLLEKKTRGKNKADVLDTFIRFCQVGSHLDSGKEIGSQPHIVAEGENKNEITQYWLSIDHKVILLGDNIITAVDLYFKAFSVFDICYPNCLVNFLSFLEVAVFRLPAAKAVSPIVQELWAAVEAKRKNLNSGT